MKHHFGDLLDRSGDYWTSIPNRERYAYLADGPIRNLSAVRILTLHKTQEEMHWKQVFDCPQLEELILQDPSKVQVEAIRQLKNLKRLRVSFYRPKDIGFIADLSGLEELILEYVSGFSDLSPLRELPHLRSLHLENLRRVSDFSGLHGIRHLRYLHIDGTLDWNQPIQDFEFLRGLPDLEVFSLGFINCPQPYPALLPLLSLQKLKKIRIARNLFKTPEYAFLQAAFPDLPGCDWDLCWDFHDKYEFLGKRAGFVNKNHPKVNERCEAFKAVFEEMKREAEVLIRKYRK